MKEPGVSFERIWQDDIYRTISGYPSAVRAGQFLFLSGQVAWHPTHGLVRGGVDLPPEARGLQTGFSFVDRLEGPIAAQVWSVYQSVRQALRSQGSDIDQILFARYYQKDKRFFRSFERLRMEFEVGGGAPASGLGASRLQRSANAWIDYNALAIIPKDGQGREVVKPKNVLPSPSFYHQGVKAGPYLFVAGHIPIDTSKPGMPVIRGFDDVPEEGRFLRTGRSHPDSRDGPIAAQTWFCYNEIRKLIESQHATMRDVINVVVYLQDIRDLPTYHRVHQHFFPDNPPALTIVGFDEVGHRGTLIEIEPIVLLPGHGITRASIPSQNKRLHAPAGSIAGPLVFLSAVMGWNGEQAVQGPAELSHEGRSVVERLCDSNQVAAAQAWMAIADMSATLAQIGLTLKDVVRLTVYLQDIEYFGAVDAMWKACAGAALPALALVQIPAPGPDPSLLLSLEAIAWKS